MNARSYRVNLILSPLDFPPILGLGESSISYRSEPPQILNNKVILAITKKYILLDMNTKKEHEILAAQSVYEVPVNKIVNREDVYDIYNDATLGLNEAYQYAKMKMPTLSTIIFPNLPIENYKREIDRVFNLFNSQN